VSYERLSAQGATLLCAESSAAPLQIGALCLFEAGPLRDAAGCLRMGDLRRHIESRLAGAPRFRQKLSPIPFDLGRPVWADDPSFDIANHVRAAALPRPGGQAELRTFVAALLEAPLDRSRPLWECWFVDGVEGDRIAVVVKVNHVMADGMAVLEFALSVLDADPRADAETPAPWIPAPPPGSGPLLVHALTDQLHRRVDAGWRAVTAPRHPARLISSVRTLVNAVKMTAVPAPKLVITRPVGPHRDFVWVRLPLRDLREIAGGQRVTLNDVVLAIVARALGDYLEDETGPAEVRPRVVVPVSTHIRPGEVENRFSLMIADLPAGSLDPVSRLREVHGDMLARKESRQAMLGPLLFALGELVTPRLLRTVAAVALRRQPFANLAVTNLPGTDDRAFLLGSRLLELYPFVTVTGNIALIIGVVSYDGTLGVGLTADADVIGDLDRLAAAIEGSAAELTAAVRADIEGLAGREARMPELVGP